jgi:hypothetical protein
VGTYGVSEGEVGKKLRRCHLSIEEVWTWAHYILALTEPMVGE